MRKEIDFLIYCMERYRYFKGLSGKEAAALFEQYDMYHYISKYFEVLHTMGDLALTADFDQYIAAATERKGQ